jgi:hypothetical protein
VKFQRDESGRHLGQPYWTSRCRRYRLAYWEGELARPWRLYRRRKGNGWGWIGVGSGFLTREEAEREAAGR